jgi:hypothetical protein
MKTEPVSLLVGDAKTDAREKTQDPVLGMQVLSGEHYAIILHYNPKSPLFSD